MILELIQDRKPDAKVLLLGVFPRDEKPDAVKRQINVGINERIAKMADGERVHFLDVSEKFLAADGTLLKEIMPDFLHPKEKGYRIWAEAMEPKIKELLGE
jgi:lysophospholipase L1-like esterase